MYKNKLFNSILKPLSNKKIILKQYVQLEFEYLYYNLVFNIRNTDNVMKLSMIVTLLII